MTAPAHGWRPIESAPRDGTAILGWADGSFAVVHWVDWGRGDGDWQLTETGSFADDGPWWPTHWQPLPPPPEPGDG